MKPSDIPNQFSSMADKALNELRRRILDNEWPPGYQALEQEVALALGMSRTPVREALVCLENEGLVELLPRRGMRVLPVSAHDMREIYEVLTSLECTAVRLVTSRKPDEEQLQALDEAARDMLEALKRGEAGLTAWAAADERFHEQLLVLCGNRHLIDTVRNYWDRAHRARMFSLRLRPLPFESSQEHLKLVELIRAGEPELAVQLNKSHRERASRELLDIFEHYNIKQL